MHVCIQRLEVAIGVSHSHFQPYFGDKVFQCIWSPLIQLSSLRGHPRSPPVPVSPALGL